jgi:hypothetical protein
MIYENDGNLDSDAAKYGCYCLAIAHFDPSIDDTKFDKAWSEAKALGILDKDSVLLDPQGFVGLLGYSLKYRSGHWPLGLVVDPTKAHIIAEWHNDSTGFTHFVVHAEGVITREGVTYDPIQGGSRTVREGYPVSLRIFDRV